MNKCIGTAECRYINLFVVKSDKDCKDKNQ